MWMKMGIRTRVVLAVRHNQILHLRCMSLCLRQRTQGSQVLNDAC
jgi:hypothetical protein